MKKSEQYEKHLAENPAIWPGPQQYWRTKPEKIGFMKNKSKEKENFEVEEEEVNGKMVKKYFMSRKITDRRICKPMKNYIF